MDANGAINQVLAPLYRPDPGSPNTVAGVLPLFSTVRPMGAQRQAQSPADDADAVPGILADRGLRGPQERRAPNLQ
jgi:hypothetical protein